MMFAASYPARLLPERSGKGFHVRFPDFPEALTGGDDLRDTLTQAADCLAEAIAGRINRGEPIPLPSRPKRGQYSISVPLQIAPKLALYLVMREQGLTQVEVAKRLGVREAMVRRMLSPKKDADPAMIERALRALGKRVVLAFEDAA